MGEREREWEATTEETYSLFINSFAIILSLFRQRPDNIMQCNNLCVFDNPSYQKNNTNLDKWYVNKFYKYMIFFVAFEHIQRFAR